MINLERAKEEFINYTNEFDIKDFNIERKIGHSIRVMNISKRLAESLDLEQEEIELATLIGLLHDIGRFKQYETYKTYNDLKSVDHGKMGAEILKENNYIRNYIKDNKYDPIIEKALRNHNAYELEKGLNKQEELFCNIIRDSDKLDIIYQATEIFWKEKLNEIEQEETSEGIEEKFFDSKLIENKLKNTQIDNMVGIISFIYDINFKESFEIIKREDYINKIINRFDFKEDIKERMEKIRKRANEYIELKTK